MKRRENVQGRFTPKIQTIKRVYPRQLQKDKPFISDGRERRMMRQIIYLIRIKHWLMV